MDKKEKELKNDIKDSLTCFICLDKLNNPLMCPKCKRLCCSECLNKWFNDNNHNCPYCKSQMNLNEMISLPFINNMYDYFFKHIDIDEKKQNQEQEQEQEQEANLNQIIESESDDDIDLSSKNPLSKTQIIYDDKNKIDQLSRSYIRPGSGQKCSKHPSQILEYICLDCDKKYCSKCLMITNKDFKLHENHSIITIEKYKDNNIEQIMNTTKNFPNLTKTLGDYNNKIITEIKICNKEEEICNDIKNKIQNVIDNKIQKAKNYLSNKNSEINSKIEEITNISMTSKDAIHNIIKRNDFNGLKEYREQILNINEKIKNMNRFNIINENKISLKINFNLYESEFIEVKIDKNSKDLFGEMKIKIENKNYQMKVISEGEEDVSFNFMIKKEGNTEYYAYCIVKVIDNVYLIDLDQKIEQDDFVILLRHISKKEFISFCNYGDKCKIKFIVSSLNS